MMHVEVMYPAAAVTHLKEVDLMVLVLGVGVKNLGADQGRRKEERRNGDRKTGR